MKKILVLGSVLLLGLCALMVWQPYRTVDQFAAAMRAGDTEKAIEYVDFPAFRKSLKADAREVAAESKGLEGFLTKVLVNTLGDATIDTLVTEENFVTLFREKSDQNDIEKEYTIDFLSTDQAVTNDAFLLTRSGLFTWKFTGFADQASTRSR